MLSIQSLALSNSFSGKSIVFYLGGARFKAYLHPNVCVTMSLSPRFIFLFTSICVMFLDPNIFSHSLYNITTLQNINISSFFHTFHTLCREIVEIWWCAESGVWNNEEIWCVDFWDPAIRDSSFSPINHWIVNLNPRYILGTFWWPRLWITLIERTQTR